MQTNEGRAALPRIVVIEGGSDKARRGSAPALCRLVPDL